MDEQQAALRLAAYVASNAGTITNALHVHARRMEEAADESAKEPGGGNHALRQVVVAEAARAREVAATLERMVEPDPDVVGPGPIEPDPNDP